MKSLADLAATRENWLMNRGLGYAKERNYVKYTSLPTIPITNTGNNVTMRGRITALTHRPDLNRC